MNHLVAHAVGNTLLFHDWDEARALWDRLVAALPGAQAIILMPNHIHVLHPRATEIELRRALRAYARWRNHHRGARGAVWRRVEPPERKEGAQKIAGCERYIHLNPSRAGLCADPLAWAFSTYRDAVGLSAFPVRRAARDPAEYHRFTSNDTAVRIGGTPFPTAAGRDPTPQQVLRAVSAVTRTPLAGLRRHGRARTLLVAALRGLTRATIDEIAGIAGLSRSQIKRIRPAADGAVAIIATVAGDVRFGALEAVDLLARWRGEREGFPRRRTAG